MIGPMHFFLRFFFSQNGKLGPTLKPIGGEV